MEVVVDNDSLKQDSNFLMVKNLSSKSRKDSLHYFSTSPPALLNANLSHSQIIYYLFLTKGDKTLGLYVDSHFSWKFYIFHISRRVKRFIGMTFKNIDNSLADKSLLSYICTVINIQVNDVMYLYNAVLFYLFFYVTLLFK